MRILQFGESLRDFGSSHTIVEKSCRPFRQKSQLDDDPFEKRRKSLIDDPIHRIFNSRVVETVRVGPGSETGRNFQSNFDPQENKNDNDSKEFKSR